MRSDDMPLNEMAPTHEDIDATKAFAVADAYDRLIKEMEGIEGVRFAIAQATAARAFWMLEAERHVHQELDPDME